MSDALLERQSAGQRGADEARTRGVAVGYARCDGMDGETE